MRMRVPGAGQSPTTAAAAARSVVLFGRCQRSGTATSRSRRRRPGSRTRRRRAGGACRPSARASPGRPPCRPGTQRRGVRAPGALGQLDRGAVRALVADHQPAAASAAVRALGDEPPGRQDGAAPRSSRRPRRRRRRTSCWRRCRCTPRRARCRPSRWAPSLGPVLGASLGGASVGSPDGASRRGLAARRRDAALAGRRPGPGRGRGGRGGAARRAAGGDDERQQGARSVGRGSAVASRACAAG